jgi:hypothetical protein
LHKNPGTTPITATITVTPVNTSGATVCPGESKTFTITVNPSAVVEAGGPDVVCQSSSPSAITLTGASVSGGTTTGTWSITSGTGTLSNTNPTTSPATVTFTPTAGSFGTVTLTLTGADPDGAGPCPAVTDTRTITVNEAATAEAGGPDIVCQSATPSAIALAGASVGGGATNWCMVYCIWWG